MMLSANRRMSIQVYGDYFHGDCVDGEDAVVTVLVWRLVVNQMPMWFRLILTVPLFNVQIVNDCCPAIYSFT